MLSNVCIHCSVPLVVAEVDLQRKVALLKCPVCGYMVVIRLAIEISGYEEMHWLRLQQAEHREALPNA